MKNIQHHLTLLSLYCISFYYNNCFHANTQQALISSKKEIKEAFIIDRLAIQLSNMLQLQKRFSQFPNTLPSGCYHSGSYFITCPHTKIADCRRKRERKNIPDSEQIDNTFLTVSYYLIHTTSASSLSTNHRFPECL